MNQKLIELALRKQRLQLHVEMQRQDLTWRAEGLTPLFHTADKVRDGARWAKEHATWLAGGALAVVALKPRLLVRVAKRGWGAWHTFKRISARVAPIIAIVQHVRKNQEQEKKHELQHEKHQLQRQLRVERQR